MIGIGSFELWWNSPFRKRSWCFEIDRCGNGCIILALGVVGITYLIGECRKD